MHYYSRTCHNQAHDYTIIIKQPLITGTIEITVVCLCVILAYAVLLAGSGPDPRPDSISERTDAVFTDNYASIQQVMSINPVVIASKLFSMRLIGEVTHDEVTSSNTPKYSKAGILARAVQVFIRTNADPVGKLEVFLDILCETEPAAEAMAQKIKEEGDYREMHNNIFTSLSTPQIHWGQ